MATRKKAVIKSLSKKKDREDKIRSDTFRRANTKTARAMAFLKSEAKLNRGTAKAKEKGNKAVEKDRVNQRILAQKRVLKKKRKREAEFNPEKISI